MSGMTKSIKEQWQKPREDFENAVAAAKLVVIHGRRKPVDICGRMRKRRVAFEEMAKRMLGYLEDSEDLQVGIRAGGSRCFHLSRQ